MGTRSMIHVITHDVYYVKHRKICESNPEHFNDDSI